MDKKPSKSEAFTLIEILIATAIFATVMIIVVATFTWAVGYNSRLRETRRVGQEARGAMGQLTRDIRLANGSGKVTIGSTTTDIGEITLFLCGTTSNSSCVPVFQDVAGRYKNDLTATTDPSGTPILSDAVLILKQNTNEAVLYRSIKTSGNNYKLTMTVKTDITNFNNLNISTSFPSSAITNLQPDGMSMQVYFGGYCGTKLSRKQQPYAEIYMIGQTYDYDKLQPNARSKFHLRTTIESRDYNN